MDGTGNGRVKWALRTLAWAALLALPCVWLAPHYEHGLLVVVSVALGQPVGVDGAKVSDLSASNMLGVYAAMCLATTSAPRRRRLAALALGLVAMAAAEAVTGIAAVAAAWRQESHGAWPESARRLLAAALAFPRFTCAPIAWLLLLGPSVRRSAARREPSPARTERRTRETASRPR